MSLALNNWTQNWLNEAILVRSHQLKDSCIFFYLFMYYFFRQEENIFCNPLDEYVKTKKQMKLTGILSGYLSLILVDSAFLCSGKRKNKHT